MLIREQCRKVCPRCVCVEKQVLAPIVSDDLCGESLQKVEKLLYKVIYGGQINHCTHLPNMKLLA